MLRWLKGVLRKWLLEEKPKEVTQQEKRPRRSLKKERRREGQIAALCKKSGLPEDISERVEYFQLLNNMTSKEVAELLGMKAATYLYQMYRNKSIPKKQSIIDAIKSLKIDQYQPISKMTRMIPIPLDMKLPRKGKVVAMTEGTRTIRCLVKDVDIDAKLVTVIELTT